MYSFSGHQNNVFVRSSKTWYTYKVDTWNAGDIERRPRILRLRDEQALIAADQQPFVVQNLGTINVQILRALQFKE